MTPFLKVEDKIQQLSEGKIQIRYRKPTLPAILIILAMPLIWFGGREAFLHEGASYLLSIIGIIIMIVGVVMLLMNKRYFILKSSNIPFKPIRLKLDNSNMEQIVEWMGQDKINEILKYRTSADSPLMIELWYHKKHDKVYSQLYFYKDAAMRPISLVHVSRYIDLDLPYKDK